MVLKYILYKATLITWQITVAVIFYCFKHLLYPFWVLKMWFHLAPPELLVLLTDPIVKCKGDNLQSILSAHNKSHDSNTWPSWGPRGGAAIAFPAGIFVRSSGPWTTLSAAFFMDFAMRAADFADILIPFTIVISEDPSKITEIFDLAFPKPVL